MHMNRVLDRVKSELIRPAISESRFDPATRHPNRETVGMVISSPTRIIVVVALQGMECVQTRRPK